MSVNAPAIPAIFEGAVEYRDVPEALELAQATFNEEALYRAIAGFAMRWHDIAKRPARILDLCSATGLSALRVAREIPVASATLVDVEPVMLEKSATYFKSVCPLSTHRTDAVEFKSSVLYDIILMNSAYHHVEDARKLAFLRNAAGNLAPGGAILVGEHFLPPYKNREEFRAGVVQFYEQLVAELEKRGETTEAIAVIRRSGLYCWAGEYEYKVSWDFFARHVADAQLQVSTIQRVWTCPHQGNGLNNVGSLAVVLEKPK
jgi:SAM-dependent methyltransferase